VPDATEILHAAGLRRTPARAAVIERLAASGRPLSVQELQSQMPAGSDLVTVYRTLNTLVRKALARRVRSDDRGWLFELSVADARQAEHGHAHFVCDSCGTVECLPDVPMPDVVAARGKLREGYEVTKQEVTLHGVCPDCHE
jgi:Fur family transcriptional regulator, ferric uptake regulator